VAEAKSALFELCNCEQILNLSQSDTSAAILKSIGVDLRQARSTMATAGAQRVDPRLTVKDVLDTASSEGLHMTTEKAEDYLIHHCVSLWYSMQACGREYVLERLKNAFREQKQKGGVQEREHSPFDSGEQYCCPPRGLNGDRRAPSCLSNFEGLVTRCGVRCRPYDRIG